MKLEITGEKKSFVFLKITKKFKKNIISSTVLDPISKFIYIHSVNKLDRNDNAVVLMAEWQFYSSKSSQKSLDWPF